MQYLVFGDGFQKFLHWDICANHAQKNALRSLLKINIQQ